MKELRKSTCVLDTRGTLRLNLFIGFYLGRHIKEEKKNINIAERAVDFWIDLDCSRLMINWLSATRSIYPLTDYSNIKVFFDWQLQARSLIDCNEIDALID